MSKTYKHQATFDYLHGRKDKVKGNLLKGLRRYFMRCLYSKYDGSRISWFKHKNRNDYSKDKNYSEEKDERNM